MTNDERMTRRATLRWHALWVGCLLLSLGLLLHPASPEDVPAALAQWLLAGELAAGARTALVLVLLGAGALACGLAGMMQSALRHLHRQPAACPRPRHA